jgi:hypothetical protein
MPTAEIEVCLRDGVESKGVGIAPAAAEERLRLELFIRERNLRNAA